MGVVTGVPTDLTEEEAQRYLQVPSGCGEILKVRRINRKVIIDGVTEFKSTETCVLTFDGQVLPPRGFCCYTSLPVQQYVYPTIQCRKCCRFGHVELVCRSKPRCSKCGHDHPGDGCSISEAEAFCVLCSGNHFANSKSCPELGRQKAIKTVMAEKSLSYAEASKTVPLASRNYANATKAVPTSTQLEWLVESRDLLPSNQFGFRKGLSTMDSVAILVTDIRTAFSKNESAVAAFLDISSAYDSVLLPVLRQKLLQLRIPGKMVQCICALLMSRFLMLRVQGEVFEVRQTWKGLPQGSVLSPLLYNLYTADIGSCLNSDCQLLQYADDLVLYVVNPSIVDAASSLCLSLDSLHTWLLDHGLQLSAPKSSVVIFSRKLLIPQVSVNIQGQGIPIAKKAKFLGVYLDSKLSGIHHINYLIKRCERAISILKALAGVWWGAHPFTMKLVYNALVRSILDYGSHLVIPGECVALLEACRFIESHEINIGVICSPLVVSKPYPRIPFELNSIVLLSWKLKIPFTPALGKKK
ncbi:hypothetical protein B5X24_HaOG211199 [Helicoverpa armigera]|nr:hypothetical protein B5X24_HaOG211199 [Helicoverpa armigera]